MWKTAGASGLLFQITLRKPHCATVVLSQICAYSLKAKPCNNQLREISVFCGKGEENKNLTKLSYSLT